MTAKRLVLLTGDGFPHRYVANMLCAAFPVERIIVEVPSVPKPNFRRALKRGLGYFVSRALRRAFLKAIGDDKARRRALRNLFGATAESFAAADKVARVPAINGAASVALIREADPDIVLVYGTSIVKEPVLRLAHDVVLNMHTGISPYYRGAGCEIWPLANGDFDRIGATIHECTANVDGGTMYETARAVCQTGDDLHTLFGRTVMVGADAYVRVVRRYLSGETQGMRQDLGLGREYRGADLTLGPEIKARFRLRLLRLGLRGGQSRRSAECY